MKCCFSSAFRITFDSLKRENYSEPFYQNISVVCFIFWQGTTWQNILIFSYFWQVTGIPVVFMSALEGRGRIAVMRQVIDTYEKWCLRLSTSRLNRWLRKVNILLKCSVLTLALQNLLLGCVTSRNCKWHGCWGVAIALRHSQGSRRPSALRA